jgi:hypothetical protein
MRSLIFWKSSIVSGDVDRLSHRDEVEHGVGRAAEHHRDDHGVLEGLAGHDVARLDVALEQDLDGRARARGTRRSCPLVLGGVDEL